jgi:DNA-directed RNA polymerase sigma subunit (sigma70/sigma32)
MKPRKPREYAPRDVQNFKDIADELGITRQRAEQIFYSALNKSKKLLAKRNMKLEDLLHG